MTHPQRPITRRRGFTMIELVIVMAIVSILALMLVPSYIERLVREEVLEGKKLAAIAMKGVAAVYSSTGGMPLDNAAAGVPPPDKLVNNLVSAVTVAEGAVTVTFGNNAHAALQGKKLTWRPIFVRGYSQVPIDWLCNQMPVPPNMEVLGKNESNLENKYLPMECRPPVPKK